LAIHASVAASRSTTSSALRPDGKRSVDPLRPRGGRALLVEELAADAVRVAHQHVGPVARATQRPLGDREVVVDQIELAVARVGEEHLVRIRDRDLAAGDREHRARFPPASGSAHGCSSSARSFVVVFQLRIVMLR
jgi:hypothetical protein